jgi:glycosyltransferase involved in cell wall biosynthesis
MNLTVSVFTPVHKYREQELLALRESIKSANEWIVLLNGEALRHEQEIKDKFPEATVHTTQVTQNVGYLKNLCCFHAKGDILVEVDYDDYLTPGAIETIKKEFEQNPQVQFVYSNSVEFKEDGTDIIYSSYWGWHNRPYEGRTQMVAFPPSAHYMRRIEWAPNHVRAFRKSAYNEVGGYDKNVVVGDDHELICRFYINYGAAGFKHIDECLYMYRIHTDNTCNGSNLNKEVQQQVELNYIKYSEDMYLRWAKDNNLACYDLGGRFDCPEGYQSIDLMDADIEMDLNQPWDSIPDNSVGVLRAYHIIEHLKDPIHFFNEAWRVLADGGFILIEVPSTNGELAFSDPTHISFFNPSSFEYYTDEKKAKYIRPMFKGRFQQLRKKEYYWGDNKPVVSVHMAALKGGWYDNRFCGEKLI